jgi:DNA-binding PadR family transcriptional regulator
MTSQNTTKDNVYGPTSAEYPVLAVLSLGPVHGYDVWQYLRRNLGTVWQLRRSQVYGLLSQMEREGLARHERVEQTNLPARKVFQLTARGQEEFDRWLREPVHHVREFRLEFPTKLHFARARSAAIAAELVTNQVAACRGKKVELEKAKEGCASDIEQLVFAYRIGIVEATVKWLQDLLKAESDRSPGNARHPGRAWGRPEGADESPPPSSAAAKSPQSR